MADLTTSYMGLRLKNPIILGASNMVTKPDIVEQLEEAGVAAFVYKSLFEEQIQMETMQLDEDLREYEERNAEMTRLFPNVEHAGPAEHLLQVKLFREKVKVPVIASLNAVYDITWVDYAKELEQTGVNALELNLFAVPGYFELECEKIEERQVQIVQSVKKAVKIPVGVKLSPFYTNPLNFIKKLDEAGADGFVLFNRFFQPEIDIEKESFFFPWELSQLRDYHLPLRFAGLLYKNTEASICTSSGIYTHEELIKMLLAGADAVQIVSTVYRSKPPHVAKMLKETKAWMEKKGYVKLDDFKGKLSRENMADPFEYQRAQYIDILMKSEEVFKKYPVI